MVMKGKLLVVCATTLVSSCASPPKYDYVKQGVSEYQRTDAISECKYQIQLNKTPPEQQPELIKLCMQGKGFRLMQVK
jgi:hypothetical protein